MRAARQANLLGALALGTVDRLRDAVLDRNARSLSAGAALIHLRLRPGQTIDLRARVLGISHPVAVRLVDRLENEGLVDRRPGADARSRSLVLTKTGQRAAVAALRNRLEVLDGVLAPLTVTERDELERLLEKLLAGMIRSRGAARHICRLCDFPTCDQPACPVDRAAEEPGMATSPVGPVR